MGRDYYSVLGVSKTATDEELKKAYRYVLTDYCLRYFQLEVDGAIGWLLPYPALYIEAHPMSMIVRQPHLSHTGPILQCFWFYRYHAHRRHAPPPQHTFSYTFHLIARAGN